MSDTTSNRKIPSGLRLVKRTTAFGVSEDGKVGNTPIEISVNTDNLKFYIPLPKYVADAVNQGAGSAVAESAPEAVAEFERLCDQYSRVRLLAGLEPQPMVLAWAITPASVSARADHTLVGNCDYYLGLNYMHVFVVRPGGEIRIFERNGNALGEEITHDAYSTTHPGVLLPDIREVREKLDALLKSTALAASMLDSVFTQPDPLVALMNIEIGEKAKPVEMRYEVVTDPVPPTQGRLPLEDGGDPINPAPSPAPASDEAKPFIDPDL